MQKHSVQNNSIGYLCTLAGGENNLSSCFTEMVKEIPCNGPPSCCIFGMKYVKMNLCMFHR